MMTIQEKTSVIDPLTKRKIFINRAQIEETIKVLNQLATHKNMQSPKYKRKRPVGIYTDTNRLLETRETKKTTTIQFGNSTAEISGEFRWENETKVPYGSQEIIHEGTLYKIDIDDTTHGTIEQGGTITYEGPITINWDKDQTKIESITKN